MRNSDHDRLITPLNSITNPIISKLTKFTVSAIKARWADASVAGTVVMTVTGASVEAVALLLAWNGVLRARRARALHCNNNISIANSR